jgi:hypothetical protein
MGETIWMRRLRLAREGGRRVLHLRLRSVSGTASRATRERLQLQQIHIEVANSKITFLQTGFSGLIREVNQSCSEDLHGLGESLRHGWS